ncbi:GH32 C-terminal domain-containing protein [Metabacillus mangrovi]
MKADAIELKVRAEKENIRVYADGVLLLEASDPSFENGYFGLVNDSALSVFRDVSFKNQSNFQTNLTRWQEVSGAWKKTLFGMKPKNKGTNVYLSSASESQFSYSAKLAFNTKGIGGLLFRADEAGKNGYLAELDGGRRIIKLIRIEGGKQQVLGIKAISVQNGTADLNVEADGAELSVMVNGEKVLAHRDSRFTAGALGIVSQGENMTFQNVRKQSFVGEVPEYIENPDFEKGTLEGWTPLEGTAFTDKQVSPADTYWGGPFDHQGRYHLWGAAETGDDPTGSVRSSYFKLSGSGEINFLIGGGNDRENLHVSLVRASDNRELIRSHNYRFNDDEKYRRVVWDASSYLGEKVYIKITDRKSGGWGHINADDFHVYNEGPVPEKPENDPNAGPGPLYEQKSSGALTVWNPLGGEWTTATEGSYGGIWECPELIQIPVEGEPGKKKWVMMVSINDGAPAGGSGMQYFTGDFDGKTFTNDHPPEKILWADYGADFYAAVTWNNTPGEKPIWLGWMSNWQYANDTPTSPWKSSMTVPRELVMSKESDGYRLKQAPVAQLQNLRENKVEYINKEIAPGENLLENVTGDTAEIETEFAAAGAEEAGIKVRTGGGQYTKIGYNPEKQTVFIDRTHSGFDFGPNVRKVHEAPVKAENEKIKLKILLDRSSIEVFVNDGEKVLTDQLFANPESQGMEFYTVNGKAQIDYLRVFDVKGIWGESPFRTNLTDFKPLDGQWGDTIAGKLGRSSADSFNISGTKAKDFTYSAKIRVLNEGAGALVFRADRSANNGYFVNIDTKHNVMKLMKRSNGSIQILKEEPHPFESNKEYEVKVTARGDEIQAFVNGSAIIKAFDSEFAEGYAGLNVWNATAVFQDVRLEQ